LPPVDVGIREMKPQLRQPMLGFRETPIREVGLFLALVFFGQTYWIRMSWNDAGIAGESLPVSSPSVDQPSATSEYVVCGNVSIRIVTAL
jgi:hypothetical protein